MHQLWPRWDFRCPHHLLRGVRPPASLALLQEFALHWLYRSAYIVHRPLALPGARGRLGSNRICILCVCVCACVSGLCGWCGYEGIDDVVVAEYPCKFWNYGLICKHFPLTKIAVRKHTYLTKLSFERCTELLGRH